MASAASLHDPADRLVAARDAASAARAGQEAKTAKAGKSGMSFWDFVDVINPLQHIPVVGTIYRELTGDTIKAPAKLAGSALFGGPVGLALAVGDQMVEAASGKSVEGHVMALFHHDQTAPDTMLAANEPGTQPDLSEDEIAALTVDRAPAAPSPVQVALAPLEAAPVPLNVASTALPAAAAADPRLANAHAAEPRPVDSRTADPRNADPRVIAARAQILAAQAQAMPAQLAAPANSPLVLDQNTDALLMAMFGGGQPASPAAPGAAAMAAAAGTGGKGLPPAAAGAIPVGAAAPIAVSPKPAQMASAAPAAGAALSEAVRPANAPRGLGLDGYRLKAGAAPVRDPMPNKFAQINQREANRAPAAATTMARPAAPAATPTAPGAGPNTDTPPLDLPAPLPREQIPAAMIAAMEKYQAQARARAAGGVDQRM